ncbi:hypothetical protein WKG92_19560 [Pantoea agglomerans]|uniref:hypothetical protein n=1 Tax=Enterobacter agglomerans TaxID=549 RepID=UPI003C7E37B1
MTQPPDQLKIIKAIEDASDAELRQLTLIVETLKNFKAGNAQNPAAPTAQVSVKRSLTKGPKNPNGEINSEQKGFYSPLQKDKKGGKNTLDKIERIKSSKNDFKGNKSTLRKDKISVHGGVTAIGPLQKDNNSPEGASKNSPAQSVNSSQISSGRDANGRFTSKNAAASVASNRDRQNAIRAEQKLQQGFFRTLGSMIGDATNNNSDSISSGADLAGTAAGGPLWMMTKGMYDISAEVGKNVITLKDWMNNRTVGNTALKTSPATVYPPVTAKAKQPPALGKPKSADGYRNAQQARAIAVTQEQTKVIAANDDLIVKGLDEVRDEVKKIQHGSSGGSSLLPAGGLLDSLIPGRRRRRVKSARKRGLMSTAADAIDIADDLMPDARTKKGEAAPKKKPAPKKKGLLGKALEVLKGGGKATAIAGATAATAATGAAVANTAGEAAADTAGKPAEAAAKKTAEKAAEKATEKTTEKAGLKVAGKVAAKTALKAIPLVGTVLGAGLDAYDGFNDVEGQRAAFGLKQGQAVSGQQKGAYTAANVIDMGGLVSGASGLLAKGASALGMNNVAKSLTFDTGDIAKGMDSGFSKVGDMFSAVTSGASSMYDKFTGTSADQTKAIKEGTDKTVGAINQLGLQLQGGEWGEDGVGSEGKAVADYADVAKNNIGADLNIGGDKAKVRSFRNNNFGNLNFVGQEGASLEATPGSGNARFAKFNTPEEGFRALANQLTSYSEGTSKAAGYKKLNTIDDIISLYAPKSENNTGQYISSLSKKMGVKSDEQLNLKDPKMMTQLMRGIATIEGGNPQVTNEWIQSAIGHNENGKWVGGRLSDESLKAVNEARSKKGEAAISADSLYTAGGKVKLARPGGTAANPAAAAAAVAAAEAGKPVPAMKNPASPQAAAIAATQAAGGNAAGVTEKIKGAGSAAWGAVKDLNQKADQMIANGAKAIGVEGMTKNRPTSGLSLPAGATLPAGLQLAALTPDQIAARSTAVSTPEAKFGSASARPASATASVTAQSARRMVFDQSEINKAVPVGSASLAQAEGSGGGLFDRVLGGAMDGIKAVGASVMPAVGDTFSQALGGFSGSDMISGVMQQAGLSDPSLLRAVSPLTSKAGGWLDSGVSSIASTGKSLLSGSSPASIQTVQQPPMLSYPKVIPSVTDLSRSGVRPMMNGDNAKHDPDMLKEMKRLTSLFEEMLGLTKKKGDAAPDKVVNTAQPAPRKSSTVSISDTVLNDILQD